MAYNLDQKTLTELVQKNILNSDQASRLWNYLEQKDTESPRFKGLHITYYFGAIICILAMTWFMNKGWEQYGGSGLTLISLAYIVAFTLAGHHFWKQKEFRIPGGLLLTVAVCIVPLLVYGLQRWTGYWTQSDPGSYRDFHIWIRGSWVLMSLATVAAGGLYMRIYRFPFLTMPVAIALYYISMDIVPLIHESASWDLRKIYSLWFGVVMIVFSYFMDRRKTVDFSFWLYLFGLMAFWGGLTSMNSHSELNKFIYCLINLFLIFLSLFLQRKTFLIFGSLGVFIYLFHLTDKVFKDSLMFPVVLALVGLGIIYLGVQYQKNQEKIDSKFTASIPKWLLNLRPQ